MSEDTAPEKGSDSELGVSEDSAPSLQAEDSPPPEQTEDSAAPEQTEDSSAPGQTEDSAAHENVEGSVPPEEAGDTPLEKTEDSPPEMDDPSLEMVEDSVIEDEEELFPTSVQRTLAIIKPNAVDKANEIEDIIIKQGFTILQRLRTQLTYDQAFDFYSEHEGKEFFPRLMAFMSSGPIVVLVLGRGNGIKYWRRLIGPTNPIEARSTHPTSIRAVYGGDIDVKNAVHGSDSAASAEREIRFFFPDTVMDSVLTADAAREYLAKYVNPTLLRGLVHLCKQKPENPVIWLADWLLANNPYKPNVE